MMSNRNRKIFKGLAILLLIVGGWFLAEEAKDWAKTLYAAHVPRTTAFPSSTSPDQVCLTWSGDPRTTQTIQWRVNPSVAEGTVQYRPKDNANATPQEVKATASEINEPLVGNDPVNRRFSALLTNLTPATTYTYRVGNPAADSWSDWSEFSTAPDGPRPFSFLYLGDAQIGYDEWGTMLRRAREQAPEATFCIMAGDQVNRGNNRDDWDAFFNASTNLFDEIPLIPTLGNHECPKEAVPRLYLSLLTLPENGPEQIPKERAYTFRYGNALFVVLDSNLEAEDQRSWLEQQLAGTDATWKFAVFHHPAYSSVGHRDNPDTRKYWSDLFDKYHVDVAFQGHDHAYLRTHPMRDGKVVSSPAEGTIYVISVSGTKYYDQDAGDFAAVAFPDVSTYQIVDIQTEGGNTLTYRSFDTEGKLRDEVKITK